MTRSGVIPNVAAKLWVAQRMNRPAIPFGTDALKVPSESVSAPAASYVRIEIPLTRFSPLASIFSSTAWTVLFPFSPTITLVISFRWNAAQAGRA